MPPLMKTVAEAVSAEHRVGVDNDSVAKYGPVVKNHVGVKDNIVADLAEASDDHAAVNTAAGPDRALLADARKRIERNPTDLQVRFELGELFINAGRFREALPELQRARQNPNARLKAMNLLGRSYSELGMLDLAAKQLEEAAKEILSMDAMKKEIVYNLGLVYERMGEREKSLNCMKQIYEADYGYKDVAMRVESSYEQKMS